MKQFYDDAKKSKTMRFFLIFQGFLKSGGEMVAFSVKNLKKICKMLKHLRIWKGGRLKKTAA